VVLDATRVCHHEASHRPALQASCVSTKRKPALRAAAPARVKAHSVEQTEASVLVLIAAAAQACRTKDIAGLVDCLENAVALYEQFPEHAQLEGSQARAVLIFVRSARDLSKALDRPDDDLQELEARAEALHSSIH
jgi:hypothetical protein